MSNEDENLEEVVVVANSGGGGGGAANRQQEAVTEATPAFNEKSIPEYDGSTDVVEWLEQATLLCGLRSVSLMAVLPTRLRGGAFAVWSRMPAATRHNLEKVKAKLFKAFAMDPFAAQAELVQRRLRPGESADVYLAALQQLAELMGGMPEKILAIFFVNGLPESTRAAVRDGMDEDFALERILDRARSVLSRAEVTDAATVVAAVRQLPSQRSGGGRGGGGRQHGPFRCWVCGQLGHIARMCPNGRGGGATSAQAPPPPTVRGAEHQ